jgi:hypothetical protein
MTHRKNGELIAAAFAKDQGNHTSFFVFPMLLPSLKPLVSPFEPDSSATGSTSNPRCRWSSLAKAALGMILAAGALTAGQAQAVVVTVNGQDWDVTTFTGSYDTDTSKFALPSLGGVMPWRGSSDLTNSFASAVSTSLGYPNFGSFEPPVFRSIQIFQRRYWG